jgi:hypothetical protein
MTQSLAAAAVHFPVHSGLCTVHSCPRTTGGARGGIECEIASPSRPVRAGIRSGTSSSSTKRGRPRTVGMTPAEFSGSAWSTLSATASRGLPCAGLSLRRLAVVMRICENGQARSRVPTWLRVHRRPESPVPVGSGGTSPPVRRSRSTWRRSRSLIIRAVGGEDDVRNGQPAVTVKIAVRSPEHGDRYPAWKRILSSLTCCD